MTQPASIFGQAAAPSTAMPPGIGVFPEHGTISRALKAGPERRIGKTIEDNGSLPGELQAAGDDLVQVLCRHAEERPKQAAFVYLLDGRPDAVMTYGELDRRARSIAVHLQERGLGGQRVLLAYPHGLDFIAGFMGCLYAGCTAVPTYLPHRRTLERFHAIVGDAGAKAILSTGSAMAQTGGGSPIPWLASDAMPDTLAGQWRRPAIAPTSLALLQYTSGSTSEPKGVMISHANLMRNTQAIHQAFGMGRDTGVFWLPAYHDMGLVGGVLEPLLAGLTSVLMTPAAFLQKPVTWLAAISKHRATISGGPNFAYDLCVRKITDEQRATLDLSCWSLAFVGAEPIEAETLERFAAAFRPCGFDSAAFYPCYGLAEATLMVAGPARGSGATLRAFRDRPLNRNRVEAAPDDGGDVRRLVGCGAPVGDLRVAIVDATGVEATADRVGEIWVKGASVGEGYWQQTDQTQRTFGAHLRDTGEGPFLRTGDLGFLHEGQLFVTGRQDDMLIVRGLNHHPQDLEATARKSHVLLQAGFGAAFAVEDEGDQRLVLVMEVTRTADTNLTPVLEAVREAVLAEHGLALHTIVLVRGGTIPKTSSGKVQRRACRAALLAGDLKPLAQDNRSDDEGNADANAAPATDHRVKGAPSSSGQSIASAAGSSILAGVCQHALALGGASLAGLTPEMPLTALGLDSLKRVELAARLEKSFGCQLPDAEFNPTQTLGDLAHAVEQRMENDARCNRLAGQIAPTHYDFTQFPEYAELKRYEHMLKAVAGDNPYFRVDQGGTASGGISRIAGKERVNFGVYDYIGMAHDPQVAAAAKAAIDRYGTSAGASRLVSGEKQVHRDLERALAGFLGAAAALVFVSGHATNVTTIGHLMGPQDLIVHDVLAHNSIIQGAQLSGATRRVFAHNDWRGADLLLSEVRHRFRRVLIAVEGVYSMDGDFPDLPRFIELRHKHRTLMLVDEAHSLGTMGRTGRGIGEHFGVDRTAVDLWMGTLSKSLASCGGYIAGSAELIEYLAYTAPGFVYSVGISPPGAAAALAALSVLEAEPQRVARLRELSAWFLNLARWRGLNTGSAAGTPVIPVIVGNSVKSLRLARALFDRGINVQPILHPAVPEHSARLRFFITTNHSETQIEKTVHAVADELSRL